MAIDFEIRNELEKRSLVGIDGLNERFVPDDELSEILTKLWDLDKNKCYPGTEYDIDLQGYVKTPRRMEDHARRKLFSFFDEETVFERPTYKAFKNLLDNYEIQCGESEKVTAQERQENWDFLDALVETEVVQEAHQLLVSRGLADEDINEFKQDLYNIWFKLVRRTKGDRDFDSSSFEHVFVGEARGDKFIGLHNWIQFYLQEKAGNIDYHGFFRRDTLRDDEIPRLIGLQFSWCGVSGKPVCSCFLGASPEFEIAAYTVLLKLQKFGKIECQMGEYEVETVCYKFGRCNVGTAYIGAARLDQ